MYSFETAKDRRERERKRQDLEDAAEQIAEKLKSGRGGSFHGVDHSNPITTHGKPKGTVFKRAVDSNNRGITNDMVVAAENDRVIAGYLDIIKHYQTTTTNDPDFQNTINERIAQNVEYIKQRMNELKRRSG